MMDFDFATILFVATLFTGAVWLIEDATTGGLFRVTPK